MTTPNTIVMVPARMASTRLPGKPLADIAGLPMIVQVMRRAEEADVGRVIVATDTQEVADAVLAHGGEAVMTSSELRAILLLFFVPIFLHLFHQLSYG